MGLLSGVSWVDLVGTIGMVSGMGRGEDLGLEERVLIATESILETFFTVWNGLLVVVWLGGVERGVVYAEVDTTVKSAFWSADCISLACSNLSCINS